MENNKTVRGLNYQIEQLQKEKEELKKETIKNRTKEVANNIFQLNSIETLNLREIENILKSFVYDIKGILED